MSPRLTLPDPPLAPPPKPQGYPDILEDSRAIADHIAALSTGEVDEKMIEEYYGNARATLRFIPMDELQEGPAEANVPSAAKQRRYAKLPALTRPPIVVQFGHIEDGHHRYRVARAAGEPGLWCYDVEDA
jgi:hypothetical protein